MGDPRHELGRRAESAVAGWLTAQGWTVLQRRWRVPEGELDLICRDRDDVLVGVEVRARHTARNGTPLESLDARALSRRRHALVRYARVAGAQCAGLRVDLVTVTPDVAGRWRLARHPAVDAW